MNKRNTNSKTDHSRKLRKENARKTRNKNIENGDKRPISCIVDKKLFDAIAAHKKKYNLSYAQIFERYLEQQK